MQQTETATAENSEVYDARVQQVRATLLVLDRAR